MDQTTSNNTRYLAIFLSREPEEKNPNKNSSRSLQNIRVQYFQDAPPLMLFKINQEIAKNRRVILSRKVSVGFPDLPRFGQEGSMEKEGIKNEIGKERKKNGRIG